MNPLPAEFFTRFGLYAEREFLTPKECASLRDEMRAATGAPATVADGQGGCHRRDVSQDEASGGFPGKPRRGSARSCSKQSPGSRNTSNGGSSACRHRNSWCTEKATSFAPTKTTARTGRARLRQAAFRLRGRVPQRSHPGDPAGLLGRLTHVLRPDGRQSERRERRPSARGRDGLLIAFPSHLVHSVSPVTAGERYTLVSWFFEDPTLQVS